MKPRKPRRMTVAALRKLVIKLASATRRPDQSALTEVELVLLMADLVGIKVGAAADGGHSIVVAVPDGLPHEYTSAVVRQLQRNAPAVANRILRGGNGHGH
jgi:hypothetical protein